MNFTFEKERMTACSPEGTAMGFVTFPRVRAGLVNIAQITVYPPFRGQGVEETMMEALLSHLDTRNQKAALTVPFAQQYLRSHPQWNHILPGSIHFTSH